MNVLLVSSISYDGVGGSSRVLRDIVEYLVLEGHHVEVLTFGAKSETVHVHVDDAHDFIAHHVGASWLPGAPSAAMMAHLVAIGVWRRFDLVLCGVASPSAMLAYLARHIIRCPYAIYSHGEDVTGVRKEGRAKRILIGPALHHAEVILANSTYTRRVIEALGVPEGRVLYMPPWVDVAQFEQVSTAEVEALRARWGLEGKRIILTVARMEARKGHDTIIRALPALCADIPNLQYVIVGRGNQEPLRTLAKEQGVADNVVFVDYANESELPALYQMCEIYAMVSRWDPRTDQVDGFGIVYLEAAACGKPSIAGSAGGCPDAVVDSVTGLIVDPTSVAQTRDALRELLLDEERAARMGEAGRMRVREQFDKQVRLQSLMHALESTIQHGNRSVGRAEQVSQRGTHSQERTTPSDAENAVQLRR